MAFRFNPFTGTLDIVGSSSSSDNFSYEYIITGNTVTIPVYQQMIVHQLLTVDGTLISDGTLVII